MFRPASKHITEPIAPPTDPFAAPLADVFDHHIQAATLRVRPEGDYRRVSMSISMTNPQRDKTSPYIEGGSRYANPGEYGYYLVVNLPHDATDVVHEDPTWTSAADDGPLQATTFTARAPVGTTRTIDVSFYGSGPRAVGTVSFARILVGSYRLCGS